MFLNLKLKLNNVLEKKNSEHVNFNYVIYFFDVKLI
jgi:hypothetical protein